jgi:hypothetical protein
MNIRARAAPPPIGALEWPAGRVLLQWALDGGIPRTGCSVLEIGSGVGTTSIGLTLACNNDFEGAQAHEPGKQQQDSAEPPTRIIATDICNTSLDNLRQNARSNGVHVHPHEQKLQAMTGTDVSSNGTLYTQAKMPWYPTLEVYKWNAGSASAIQTVPVDIRSLTHVIAADVVYSGGASSMSKSRQPPRNDSSSHTDNAQASNKPAVLHKSSLSGSEGLNTDTQTAPASSKQHTASSSPDMRPTLTQQAVSSGGPSAVSESEGCLAATFADMLAINPRLDITLLLIDRFSGPAVAAVAQVLYRCMHAF